MRQTKTPLIAASCAMPSNFRPHLYSGRVVPTEGLEPPHLAAHGPEPCASTNSATWAYKTTLCNARQLVPTEGLEPPHLAAHGPEPCASTNSATWALDRFACIARRCRRIPLRYQALPFCARPTF